MINTELLAELCACPGAPGREAPIRNKVKEVIRPYVDRLETDAIGNLYAFKKGVNNPDNKKVMIAAHLDEISFLVHFIDSNGFIRFKPLGGFDPKTLASMRVTVHGENQSIPGIIGVKPIHALSAAERKKMPELGDFFIDVGLPKEEVEKIISIGDIVSRDQELTQFGNLLNSKSLDNRVSVFILIEAMKKLENAPYDIYATFTVQEEVGIRGAEVAGHHVDPDFGIGLDVTLANDIPGIAADAHVTQLGEGVAIKIMDRGTICDYRMIDYFKEQARKHDIKHQLEVLDMGSTDTRGLQRGGKHSSIAGALSIPVRYMHQTTETAHPEDIQATIDLLAKSLANIDQFDWAHR